jgi:hypothetical protein
MTTPCSGPSATQRPTVIAFLDAAGHSPRYVTLANGAMDFEAYLATRIVELLVHADDLAVSVAAPLEPPENACAIAVETLVGAAGSLHRDLELLRSLTRPERVRQPGPTVF